MTFIRCKKRLTLLFSIAFLISGRTLYGQIPGGPYLGQDYPGTFPEPFATNVLPVFTSSITFSPDGLECFSTHWQPASPSILMSTQEGGGYWPDFDTVLFSETYDELPHLTPDGNRIYFISHRPVPPSPYYIRHLWYADRSGSGWSDPAVVGSPVFERYVISASATMNGDLYLSIDDNNNPAIYVSRLVSGNFQEPEKMSDSINYLNRPLRPHIAADESYLIFDVGETADPLSQRDLAISYRKPDGSWTKAMLFDNTVNTASNETTPFVSRDDRFLFFGSDVDTYWMDCSSIVTGTDKEAITESGPRLAQNYPNPCTGTTVISYWLPQRSAVTLRLMDMMNREVFRLVEGEQASGNHSVIFNPDQLRPGIYIYQLQTRNTMLSRRMAIDQY